MGYFADMFGDITDGIAEVAELCGYHEGPDETDAYEYYGALICDAEDQGQAIRWAITRIMIAAVRHGYDWVDGQAEICRRIVADMTDVGLLDGKRSRLLEYACEDHCW